MGDCGPERFQLRGSRAGHGFRFGSLLKAFSGLVGKLLVFPCLAIVLLLVAGGLVASEMGFKVRYQLTAGKNYLALPYRPKPSLVTVRDLFEDIGTAQAQIINRHRKDTDAFDYYSFGGGSFPPNGWTLEPGEGLVVQVGDDHQYRLVGSHDSATAIDLVGADSAASVSGSNYIAVPYHTTAQSVRELFEEIGGSIQLINRYNRQTEGFDYYSFGGGSFPPNGWDLVPGEAYIVKVGQDQTWNPSHY